MAVTTQPLIWDFYRQVSGAEELGGVIHYYDEQSQSLYLDGGGISTRTAEVLEGHWEGAVISDQINITEDTFNTLRLDHPLNGILYGVALSGNSMTFLRYVYAMDISQIIDSWSWNTQVDNRIAEFTGQVMNIGTDTFASDLTLFQPGARLTLSIRLGDSLPYSIGVAWLDECNYDISSEKVSISGRNTIGYYLKDQTFDDLKTYSGTVHDIAEQIMQFAGITKYNIQGDTRAHTFRFEPTNTLLEGVEDIIDYYARPSNTLELAELPDGTICIGADSWMSRLLPNTHYTFDVGHDIFRRVTRKTVDGSYTSLRVTGNDDNNVALTPVTVSVSNFPHWVLGAHKTKHLTAPAGMTQSELQEWAETQAQIYRYIGIGEEFSGPFRPHLMVGDVAEVIDNGEGISLGLVTEVRQTFSKSSGFKTEFSVDSGGVTTDGDNYTVYSRIARINGFNRKQKIIDMMRYVSGK